MYSHSHTKGREREREREREGGGEIVACTMFLLHAIRCSPCTGAPRTPPGGSGREGGRPAEDEAEEEEGERRHF